MIKEHEHVILTNDLSAEGLKAGDAGTVIHIHGGGVAFEVEFAPSMTRLPLLQACRVRSPCHST